MVEGKNLVVWVREFAGSRVNLGVARRERAGHACVVQPGDMMIGWTTTASRADAERLARGLVEAGLGACAQVSGPISSVYRWEGKVEEAEEFRLTVKFAAGRADEIAAWIAHHHGYDTPQWVTVRADAVMEKYLKWVLDDPT